MAVELDRTHYKRILELIEVLKGISEASDPPQELLEQFVEMYRELDRDDKPLFFEMLMEQLEVPEEEVRPMLMEAAQHQPATPLEWSRTLTHLRRRLESPRMRAFRRFLNVSGGLQFLLDLRADMLIAQRQAPVQLEPVDEEIAHLFNSWFQSGFLFLEEITQESPYKQILFLKEHDMVHPMASLEEMGNRLGEDRRCFGLFHLAMPDEPVVFIEVALTKGIARSIHEIIGDGEQAGQKRESPDTAVFYSINNTQNGLAGLGLGRVLIFQVVDALKQDNPDIKTFCTLSPIPGFWERYLKRILQGHDEGFALKREGLMKYFTEKARETLLWRYEEKRGGAPESFHQALLEILSDPQWIDDEVYSEVLEKPLTEIAYFYITQEKNPKGGPLNPVANFHLSNGATVKRRNVNFGANRSKRGLQESCGLMVNYIYSRSWLQGFGSTVQSLLPWKRK